MQSYISPQMIASLLAAMGGAMLAFSLVTEARERIREGSGWPLLPVPVVERTAYVVLALAVAADLPGMTSLIASLIVVPALLFAFRLLWVGGRRTENDPIRRALEELERRREGREGR